MDELPRATNTGRPEGIGTLQYIATNSSCLGFFSLFMGFFSSILLFVSRVVFFEDCTAYTFRKSHGNVENLNDLNISNGEEVRTRFVYNGSRFNVYAGSSKFPTLQFSISATSKFLSMKVLNYGSGISIYDMSCFGPVHNFIEVKTILIWMR